MSLKETVGGFIEAGWKKAGRRLSIPSWPDAGWFKGRACGFGPNKNVTLISKGDYSI
jgi:hypothetical protein